MLIVNYMEHHRDRSASCKTYGIFRKARFDWTIWTKRRVFHRWNRDTMKREYEKLDNPALEAFAFQAAVVMSKTGSMSKTEDFLSRGLAQYGYMNNLTLALVVDRVEFHYINL